MYFEDIEYQRFLKEIDKLARNKEEFKKQFIKINKIKLKKTSFFKERKETMKVEKEIFYHANSHNKLSIGDRLIFNSETKNKMYDSLYHKEFLYEGMDANELLGKKKQNKEYLFKTEEMNVIQNTINHDAFVMRELALEEIRSKKYPNYPSRLKCLYVTKEKEEAINWIKILKRNQKECKQIVTLELTGEIFIGDGNLMKRQNISYQKHLENAEKYWRQEANETNEYLFYGEAKVIEVEEIE